MDALLAGLLVFGITFLILLLFTGILALDVGFDSRPLFDGSPDR